MIDNMIGSDDIGADIFDDDEDEMHEAVGAALAAASHTDNHPLRAAQKAAEYAKKLGTSHRTIDFEMVIPPHTKTTVTRYPRIFFRGEKVTVNTVRGTRHTKGGGLHVRGLFVGGRTQRPLNAGDIYSSEVPMDTAWPNTPIMFLVENTSSEPKTFKAEIYGIVLEGAKPADHTRASASRVIGADAVVPVQKQTAPVVLAADQAKTVITSARVGAVLGIVAGVLLWRKHPVAGGLIGGLLVGPAAGATFGFATMRKNT